MKPQLLVQNNVSKVDATLDSRNFFVSIISIIFTALAGQGVNIINPELISGEVYDAIITGQIGTLLSVLFVNFINPMIKIVRQKTWSWAFLKSVNFWTQFATVGLLGLASFGIVFPEGAASEVVISIFGGNFETIMIATVINFLNPLWHFFKKQRNEPQLIEKNNITDKVIKDLDPELQEKVRLGEVQFFTTI